MTETNLVTTYTFNGKEYLVKMVAADKSLEIVVTDKNSGEEWECSYDSSYVETITQKTGNFKKFSVFICMLKNGLLKTSECVTLEFLTYEDLQQLRANCLRTHSSRCLRTIKASDRKYLIVNYNVEFDRIHYPLPLDYAGPPDPVILQNTVHRLQKELQKAREELANNNSNNGSHSKKIQKLQDRIEDLISENNMMREEIRMLKMRKGRNSNHKVQTLQKAIVNLEKSVVSERKSHHQLVEKLRSEKSSLLKELKETKLSEQRLKHQLNRNLESKNSKFIPANKNGTTSVYTIYRNSANNKNQKPPAPRRSRSTPVKTPEKSRPKSSRSSSISKYSNSSINDNTRPIRPYVRHCRKQRSTSHSRDSSLNSNSSRRTIARQEIDFDELQKKIESLQNMLEGNNN